MTDKKDRNWFHIFSTLLRVISIIACILIAAANVIAFVFGVMGGWQLDFGQAVWVLKKVSIETGTDGKVFWIGHPIIHHFDRYRFAHRRDWN